MAFITVSNKVITGKCRIVQIVNNRINIYWSIDFMQKVNSGSHDKQLRYNEDNHYFWLNMYSTLDRTESTSKKIEMDGMLFESALEKKNLSVDMGFRELMFGYFTFGSYFAKPEGTVISELIGSKE